MTDANDSMDPAAPPRYPRGRLLVSGVAVAAAIATAAVLGTGDILPWGQAAGFPLLLLGLALVAWNTHAALCFTAFAIAPFGVVQAELLGVTLNLPEVLILALVVKEGLRFLRDRQPFPAALPLRALAVFAAAAAIALATGFMHQNGAVRVLQDCRQFTEFLLLFWLVLQRVSGRDEALRIAACYAAGATTLAIHGIIQQVVPVGISATQISSDLVLHQGIRSGSFYGATTLGGLMVLAVAPAAGVALSSKRRSVQVLMGLCILLCVVAIIFTRTRGSWLGLAVALALIGVSVRPSGKTLAAVACAGMALALVLGPVVVQRLYTLADPEQDISLMARAQYYAAAARIGEAHPILGLGWGCYFDVDAILQAGEYVEVPFSEAASEENMKGIDRHEIPGEATVHSAYLQLFVKTGILGLGAFLALIVVWLERVWRGRNTRFQRDGTQALFVGITAGIAGYLFHSTFENFFQWPVMAQSFWLLFGLSFVLAPEPARAPRYALPLAFVAGAVAVFLMFMYVCLRLETYHTDHFERNVAQALEAGDLDKALHIARRATEVDLYEPMPFTVYARLLFMQGDTDAALAALETALGTVERPPAPRNRFTGARYYFAPARLTLGQYHAGRGEWDHALHQFELARAYADLRSEEFEEFHPLLYRTYATRGRWDRALTYGMPDTADLEQYASASLLRMARICEGREHWVLLEALAQHLLDRGDFPELAHYYLGRVYLARDDADSALSALAHAGAGESPRATFYMAEALARLGRAGEAGLIYPATRDPIYKPVALAKAWGLPARETVVFRRDSLLTELRRSIERMAPVDASPPGPKDGPTLLACTVPDRNDTCGAPFPVLLLWGTSGSGLESVDHLSLVTTDTGYMVKLGGADLTLELRWVENLVAWESIERAYPTDTVFPGWIDTGRDWFDLTDRPGAVLTEDDTASHALGLHGLAWVFSAPIVVPGDTPCLLAGQVHDPDGAGRLGWQFLDGDSAVVAHGSLAEYEALPAWARLTSWLPADPARESIRVVLETSTPESAVSYDDLVLIAIEPPVPVP